MGKDLNYINKKAKNAGDTHDVNRSSGNKSDCITHSNEVNAWDSTRPKRERQMIKTNGCETERKLLQAAGGNSLKLK